MPMLMFKHCNSSSSEFLKFQIKILFKRDTLFQFMEIYLKLDYKYLLLAYVNYSKPDSLKEKKMFILIILLNWVIFQCFLKQFKLKNKYINNVLK